MPLICFSHNHPHNLFFFFSFPGLNIPAAGSGTHGGDLKAHGRSALVTASLLGLSSVLGSLGLAHTGPSSCSPMPLLSALVDDLCSSHPLTWGAQTPSWGTAVRTNRLHALPGTNTSLGSPGPYVEERENITLVKPSIKRKKSQSDIKYSGSRPIMRFSWGTEL